MRARWWRTLAVAVSMTALWVTGVDGQSATAIGTADAVFPESFSTITVVRELADGRVMVADPLGQALAILDMDAGTSDTIGSVGQGPAEYRQPDAVWALPGDSTLLVDLGNGRLTILDPAGVFGQTMPIAQSEPSPGSPMVLAIPQGVDSEGRLYFEVRPGFGGQSTDSSALVRFDRGSEAIDTISLLKMQEMRRSGGSGGNVSISPVPLSPQDAWGVAPDGRVVVARSSDYHVEWIQPGGGITRGSPVPVDDISIRTPEKEEWWEDAQAAGGGLGVSVSMGGGGAVQMSFSRGGLGSDPNLDQYEWPDVKPPFYASRIEVDGSGRAWVRRHVDAGDAPVYDVFDGDGQRVSSVSLDASRRIVSFGNGVAYVVATDEFGLQTLERYSLGGGLIGG